MKSIVPALRPQQTLEKTLEILRSKGVTDQVAILGIRGYFEDTMGKPNQNDRGIYDDAFFLVSPRAYIACNANTDPSRFGLNTQIGKGLAVLQHGVYRYKKGLHGITHGNPYPAFVQAEKVLVLRDGGKLERDWLSINIHKGGVGTTSSLGCQTAYPTQWLEFQETGYAEMDFYKQLTIPYCLVEAA